MNKPRVILIDIIEPQSSKEAALKSMIELENLVKTFGGFVIIKRVQKKQIPNYQTYIGTGKLKEIVIDAQANSVELLIFNNTLKTKQIFNIQWKIGQEIQIWDRVDLILKIFEKHASTSEAKLQIELAALKHMGPRIFGMGMELSKQGAGIGTRGKGETNTEIMKRHLKEQEKKIVKQLEKITQRQKGQRIRRKRQYLKTIAIVGYTNAGKSQLLHSLTQKNIKIKNELFATLETRIGQLFLPQSQTTCLMSDTIGFIKNLPLNLIDAFRSTLDEAIHADILLHVIDYSDPEKYEKIKIVQEILKILGADTIPCIFVCNKIDLIKIKSTQSFEKRYKKYQPVFISALEKKKIDTLLFTIEQTLKLV